MTLSLILTLNLTIKSDTKNPTPNPNLTNWRQGTRKVQTIVVLSPKVDQFSI